jgi:hypothetical protein
MVLSSHPIESLRLEPIRLCRHPSIRTLLRAIFGASRAFSFQQALLPVNRPWLSYLRREVGPGLGRSRLNSAVPLDDSDPALRDCAYAGAVVAQGLVHLAADP